MRLKRLNRIEDALLIAWKGFRVVLMIVFQGLDPLPKLLKVFPRIFKRVFVKARLLALCRLRYDCGRRRRFRFFFLI